MRRLDRLLSTSSLVKAIWSTLILERIRPTFGWTTRRNGFLTLLSF